MSIESPLKEAMPSWWRYRDRCRWLARGWRYVGRSWATAGEQRRSELCHQLADYWEQPFLWQFFVYHEASAAFDELMALTKGESE